MQNRSGNLIYLTDYLKPINDADLQYYLLSPRNPPPEYTKLHDDVFDFWLNIWKPTLASIGYSDSHLHDDFIRQDVISCICAGGKVVGVLLFAFYSLDAKAPKTFRYMTDNYPEEFFTKIKALGVRTAMSMQYLAVHPDWRGKTNPQAPIGLLTVGMSYRVRDLYGIDASIAPARKDHKVNDLTKAHQSESIISDFISHNVPCDLIACLSGKPYEHASPQIRAIEKALWENRIDTTTSGHIAPKIKKTA